MSTNNNDDVLVDPDGLPQETTGVVPKLVQLRRPEEGFPYKIEVEPLVVTRLGGTLPWDTESTQLQCGETVTDAGGDLNIRLVYHAIITHTDFKRLSRMRSNPTEVKLVSRAYTGPVTFDQLKFDRIPDANGAVTRDDGEISDPLYEIQLQSKENDDDEGFSFIADN